MMTLETLETLEQNFTVCKVEDLSQVKLGSAFCFLGRTDEEISLVCVTEDAPDKTLERVDGWRGFRIKGVLDFSLTGVLSRLSKVLADEGVGIFAVSTFNTDYVFVRAGDFARALASLERAGYNIP